MADITKRMNYFDRQFLRALDFQDEQAYYLDRRWRHNRLLHTPGVAEGLEVSGSTGDTEVTVAPGTAIAPGTALYPPGREIVLATARTVNMSGAPDGTVEIYIAYSEIETDPSTDPGITGNTRVTEGATFFIVPDNPLPADGVLLASVSVSSGALEADPDNSVRTPAAAVVDNDIAVDSLSLKCENLDSTQWPKLNCDGVNGDLLFSTGDPVVSERVRIKSDGNVGIGTNTASQKLTVNGNIKLGNRIYGTGIGAGDFLWLMLNNETEGSPGHVMGLYSDGLIVDNNKVTINGKVGIGKNDPQLKLEVDAGSGAALAIRTTHNDAIQFFGDSTVNTEAFTFVEGEGKGFRFFEWSKADPGGWPAKELLRITHDGNVGIGTTIPGFPLNFPDILGDKISLWGQSGNHYGFGIQSSLLQIYTDLSTSDIAFGYGSSGSFTEVMRVRGNGNIGIGITNPTYKFEVQMEPPTNNINPVAVFKTFGGTDSAGAIRFQNTHNNKFNIGITQNNDFAVAYNNNISQPTDLLRITSAGNVGIGTISPNYKMTIGQGSSDIFNYIEINSATWGGVLFHGGGRGGSIVYNHSSNNMTFGTSPGDGTGPWERIRIDKDGKVGIGTTSPDRDVDIVGSGEKYLRIRSDNNNPTGIELMRGSATFGGDTGTDWRLRNYGSFYIYSQRSADSGPQERIRISPTAAGSMYYNGNLAHSSDVRLKQNIISLENCLNKIMSLRGVSFIRNDVTENSSYRIGLVAQEVETIFPELVEYGCNGMKALNYSGLIAPIIETIKEQQQQISELKFDNLTLKKTANQGIPKSAGLDYAEYFESSNGKDIPLGTSVVMVNDKIRPAKKNETPMGIISAMPGHVCGDFSDWPKKYLRDDFGNLIMTEIKEEIKVPKKEKISRKRQKMETKTVTEEVKRMEIVVKKGKHIQKEITEKISQEIETAVFKEVNLYNATGKKVVGKHKVPVMETYVEEKIVHDKNGQPVMTGSGEFTTKKVPKINPKYNPKLEYVSRAERPEWLPVGLLGQLSLHKGQPVALSWIKIKDISKKVELWLVK